MTFYSRMQQTANKLLIGKGQPVTLTNVVPGVYDPATGGTAASTTTVQTGTGTIMDYDIRQAGIFNSPGSLIREGDKQLLLSALNTAGSEITAPDIGDTVVASGKTFTVEQVKSIAPAGTVVMFDINLRGV